MSNARKIREAQAILRMLEILVTSPDTPRIIKRMQELFKSATEGGTGSIPDNSKEVAEGGA